MTTLNSRLQLALINRKKSRNPIEKGFTLVELMIVIVIVGVLSAVAVPQFLGVRDKASAGAEIGEDVNLAKECSSAIIIDGPYPAAYPAGTATGGTNGNCRGADANTAPGAPVIFKGTLLPTNSELSIACGPVLEIVKAEACQITVDNVTGAIAYAAVDS